MAETTVKGRVIFVGRLEQGEANGKPWFKHTFAIETEGQYSVKIAFQAWNSLCDQTSALKTGQEITVSYNPVSREYNEKWYTDLKAYKVVSSHQNAPPTVKQEPVQAQTTPPVQEQSDDSLPF